MTRLHAPLILSVVTSVSQPGRPTAADPPKKVLLVASGPDGHPADDARVRRGDRHPGQVPQAGRRASRSRSRRSRAPGRRGRIWSGGPTASCCSSPRGRSGSRPTTKRLAAFRARQARRRTGRPALGHGDEGGRTDRGVRRALRRLPRRAGPQVQGRSRRSSRSPTRSTRSRPASRTSRFTTSSTTSSSSRRASTRVKPVLIADIDGAKEMVAWSWERPDGGRSFGFSGLHFHDNWKREEYRRLVAQGVLWTAKLPMPESGLAGGSAGFGLLAGEEVSTAEQNHDPARRLAAMRQEYSVGGLSEAHAGDDPFALFRLWFEQAVAAGIHEPNAFVLATARRRACRRRGSSCSRRSTTAASRSSRTTTAARAARWPRTPLSRWFSRGTRSNGRCGSRGTVEVVTPEESDSYFVTRPLGSRSGRGRRRKARSSRTASSWKRSTPRSWRNTRTGTCRGRRTGAGTACCRQVFEFWQGRPSRLHDRIQFTRRADGSWSRQRLVAVMRADRFGATLTGTRSGPPSVAPFGGHHHREDQRHHRQDDEHERTDLPPALRPLAGHLPGAAVDQDLEQLLVVAVVRHPHRQQAVLERDAEVPRLGASIRWWSPPMSLADELHDRRLHQLLGDRRALLQTDRVPLGLEPAEELGPGTAPVPPSPRLQPANEVRRARSSSRTRARRRRSAAPRRTPGTSASRTTVRVCACCPGVASVYVSVVL